MSLDNVVTTSIEWQYLGRYDTNWVIILFLHRDRLYIYIKVLSLLYTMK